MEDLNNMFPNPYYSASWLGKLNNKIHRCENCGKLTKQKDRICRDCKEVIK